MLHELNPPLARANLWLDVADLLSATGPPGGITRTVSMLLQEWLNEGIAVRLCYYNPVLGGLVEVELLDTATEDRATLSRFSVGRLVKGGLFGSLRRGMYALAGQMPTVTRALTSQMARLFPGLLRGSLNLQSPRLVRHGHRLLELTTADILVSPGSTWEQRGYPESIGRLKKSMGFRFVPIIYDAIACLFPQFFPPHVPPLFQQWLPATLVNADHVVTISENTRRDLARLASNHGLPHRNVSVIRLGEDPTPVGAHAQMCPPAGVDQSEPFVLSVGTIEVRKNHLLLYQVWRRLLETDPALTPTLHLVGRPGWISSDVRYQLAHDPLVREKIHLHSHVADGQLAWFYRSCLFTMYPSFYEGWGLPVAESLAHGKYCIASGSSSIPEIGGDLIDYHDPCDFAGCLRLVRQALVDPNSREEKERRIHSVHRPTPWRDCALSLVTALREDFGLAQPGERS